MGDLVDIFSEDASRKREGQGDSFLLHLNFPDDDLREQLVLSGDRIVCVRFVDSEEGEEKTGAWRSKRAKA